MLLELWEGYVMGSRFGRLRIAKSISSFLFEKRSSKNINWRRKMNYEVCLSVLELLTFGAGTFYLGAILMAILFTTRRQK